MKYQPNWKLLDENTLVIPYNHGEDSKWYYSITTPFEIPPEFKHFFWNKPDDYVGYIYLNYVDGTMDVVAPYGELNAGKFDRIMMELPNIMKFNPNNKLQERLKYCFEVPKAHKINLVLSKRNKWGKGHLSATKIEIFDVEVKIFRSEKANPTSLTFFEEVKDYGLGISKISGHHINHEGKGFLTNIWNQISEDRVDIKLQYYENTPGIFIPPQFLSFFNMKGRSGTDLSFQYGSMHLPAIIEFSEDKERVISYSHELQRFIWSDGGVKIDDDRRLGKYHNITIHKTNKKQLKRRLRSDQKGEKHDGICDVYKISLTHNNDKKNINKQKPKMTEVEKLLTENLPIKKEIGTAIIEDIEYPISPAERVEYTENRLKRNVSFAEQIKDLYDNTCQVCKVFLKTPIEGVGISEAAHIKAIGKPHNGDDTKANMLCLCPNHHAQFDRYTFYIEPETLEIVGLEEYKGKFISLNKKHKVNVDYFEYQKQQYLQNN